MSWTRLPAAAAKRGIKFKYDSELIEGLAQYLTFDF